MPRIRLTIRDSLVLGLFFVILLTGGSIMASTYFLGSRPSSRAFASDILQKSAARDRRQVASFFRGVEITALVTREIARDHLLDQPLEGRVRFFQAILANLPQITSVLLASDEGRELMLLHPEPGRWMSRETDIPQWGGRSRFQDWDDQGQPMGAPRWETRNYDPRQRPWFQTAMAHDTSRLPAWTEPYVFFTTGDPGITAAAGWRDADGHDHVLGMDVMLTDLSGLMAEMPVTAHGMTAVMASDGRLIGLPGARRFAGREGVRAHVLRTADNLGLAELAAAEAAWRQGGQAAGPFSFEFRGQLWLAQFDPYRMQNLELVIISLAPAADMLVGFHQRLALVLMTTLAALVVAFLLGAMMTRLYTRPLEALSDEARRIARLEFNSGAVPPESRIREVATLAAEQQRMCQALESFSRYVPVDLVRQLVARNEVARIGGESHVLTVLFTDIRDFTRTAESMRPTELTTHMSDYFTTVLDSLQADGATVDKIVGDSVLAFWGAPLPDQDHASHAAGAVLACRDALRAAADRWQGQGRPPLPTCFGLNTGELVVGNIGAPQRLNYTVLGDVVNLASRIEHLNRFYGTEILAGGAVRAVAGPGYVWRMVDHVRVRGRAAITELHELVGRAGQVDDATLDRIARYEAALAHWQRADFAGALVLLEGLVELDPVARVLQARCRRLAEAPPDANWDGAETLVGT